MSSFLRLRNHPCLLATAAIAILAAGCGPSRPATYPVTGTVTVDGKPIEGAGVMFVPEAGGRPATGSTDTDGRFTLKTFEPGDGALPGKHFVSVTKSVTSGVEADRDGLSGSVGPGGLKVEWIVPQKYADPKKSGITVEVTSDMEPVKLDLTSN